MPEKLDPEVKWKTMVGFFLNYMNHVHKVLIKELDEETHKKVTAQLGLEFWGEQAKEFISIFNIKKGDAVSVSLLERILATLLDIPLKVTKENKNEVLMECEYSYCPIRIGMKEMVGDYCIYCGMIMQFLVNQIDASFKHEMSKKGDKYLHRIARK